MSTWRLVTATTSAHPGPLRSAGVPLQLASNREEFRALAPLVVATLRALNTFSDDAFRIHLAVRSTTCVCLD